MYPFSHPQPVYSALYSLTLVAHLYLIGFVVTGAFWLAVRGVRGRPDTAVERTFRDWLPFFLGAAITAGVAPTLFVQILHRDSFYSANLLLSHRFMAIVPALLLGFYGLYLIKGSSLPPSLRRAAPWLPALAFAFVGWTFTENHLLSLAPEVWPDMYAEGRMRFADITLWPRLGMWAGLLTALGLTCLVSFPSAAGEGKRLFPVFVLALTAAIGAAIVYSMLEPALAVACGDPSFFVFAVLAVVAVLVLLLSWLGLWRGIGAAWLRRAALVAGGLVLTAVVALREGVRMVRLQGDSVARHVDFDPINASIFGAFLLANTGIVLWLLSRVRRDLSQAG